MFTPFNGALYHPFLQKNVARLVSCPPACFFFNTVSNILTHCSLSQLSYTFPCTKKNDSRPIFDISARPAAKPVSGTDRYPLNPEFPDSVVRIVVQKLFHHNSSLEALICPFCAYISTVPSESGSQMLRKSIYSLTSRQISSVCTVIGNISTGTISLTPYPFSTSFFTSWACVNGLQEI